MKPTIVFDQRKYGGAAKAGTKAAKGKTENSVSSATKGRQVTLTPPPVSPADDILERIRAKGRERAKKWRDKQRTKK
jgi:hypothetical protein